MIREFHINSFQHIQHGIKLEYLAQTIGFNQIATLEEYSMIATE